MSGVLLCAPWEKRRSTNAARAIATVVARQPSSQPARQKQRKSTSGIEERLQAIDGDRFLVRGQVELFPQVGGEGRTTSSLND